MGAPCKNHRLKTWSMAWVCARQQKSHQVFQENRLEFKQIHSFGTPMSFFLGDTSQYSYAAVDPEKVKLAEIQFNAISTTFNNVLETCQKKCISHEYGEGELNTGEASCLDRCVSKFIRANFEVGQGVRFSLTPQDMPAYQKVHEKLRDQGSQRITNWCNLESIGHKI